MAQYKDGRKAIVMTKIEEMTFLLSSLYCYVCHLFALAHAMNCIRI